jgi:hypothetical protein
MCRKLWFKKKNHLFKVRWESKVQGPMEWAILLAESHKLDPWPSDEGPTPKSDESKLNLQGTIL